MKNKTKKTIKWVEKKSWDEFRKTGLFMFINTILHVFGWALCAKIQTDVHTKEEHVTSCYPARVKYRGFEVEHQDQMHKRIADYLEKNSADLKQETLL